MKPTTIVPAVGSRIADRGSRIADRGSRIADPAGPGIDRFERLFATARHRLKLSAFDAEDVAQDAWIRMECAPAHPRRPVTAGAGEALLVRRAGLNFLRAARRRTQREHAAARSEVVGDSGRSTTTEVDPPAGRLTSRLGHLKSEDRELLVAYALEGRSQSELAFLKGLPRTTITSKLKRILTQLRASLSSAGEEE